MKTNVRTTAVLGSLLLLAACGEKKEATATKAPAASGQVQAAEKPAAGADAAAEKPDAKATEANEVAAGSAAGG